MASDPIPVAALIRYAETEASAAQARTEGAESDIFRLNNQTLWATWTCLASNLRTYSIGELQRMADEDLDDAKALR